MGLYLGSYKVILKRKCYGAYGYTLPEPCFKHSSHGVLSDFEAKLEKAARESYCSGLLPMSQWPSVGFGSQTVGASLRIGFFEGSQDLVRITGLGNNK